MTCYRADIAARRSAVAAAGAIAVRATRFEARGLTQSVVTTVNHRLGMRPFSNSKRKNNRFHVL